MESPENYILLIIFCLVSFHIKETDFPVSDDSPGADTNQVRKGVRNHFLGWWPYGARFIMYFFTR